MSNPYVKQELEQLKNKLRLLRPHLTKVGMAKVGSLIVELTDLKKDAAARDFPPADENACHRGVHYNR